MTNTQEPDDTEVATVAAMNNGPEIEEDAAEALDELDHLAGLEF